MATRSLVHVNNNIVCSLDVETTGLNPTYHEIIQLAIIPLDNWLEPRKDLPLLDLIIKPQHIHRIDEEAMTVNKIRLNDIIQKGIPTETAKMLFEHWYKKLRLQENKRIMPLGFNCAGFDLPFIREWLGFTMAGEHFHGFCRDVLQAVNYLNDVADFHAEEVPFPKLKLRDVANRVGIEVETVHDAVYDSYICQQTYKRLLSHQLLNPV